MAETQITKAETRARALADRLEEAGFTINVTFEHSAAEYYSDGDVMLPARVYVSVIADRPNDWDDSYSFSFATSLASPGRRASTRFCGGHRYRLHSKKFSKKLSLRQLRFAIGGELARAHYRAERAAQEA